MALTAGTRLGPYEVLAPLGAGGMGEVYRARDTRLGREVALKVLARHLSENAEVRARFEREAKTISSLNHPNICTLYDVGREDGIEFLVMELVEGETLAARLKKGALPVPEVLRLGAQIADALDRAHRAGVIHRDLKPGNVMLTRGRAKLMDFGLARASGLARSGSLGSGPLGALTQVSTVAAPLTAEGWIVGTFPYMSPEQLEGNEADERSDLWALGCVLYEMATGRRAFEGRSQASLISAIMAAEPPPVSQIAPLAPAGLNQLIRACLTKDPDERVRSAHDVKLQLLGMLEGSTPGGVAAPAAPAASAARLARRGALPWWVAAVAVAAAVVAVILAVATRARGPRSPLYASVVAGPRQVMTAFASMVAVSPDGRFVAYCASESSDTRGVFLRRLDSPNATSQLLSDRIGALFWSPDSRAVGVASLDGHELVTVPIEGGSPTELGATTSGRGGTWNRQGVVVFAPSAQGPLFAVSTSGGDPRQVTWPDAARQESGHRFPAFLPDGERFLYAALPAGPEGFDIYVGSLESREARKILTAQSAATYAPPGYLLFRRHDKLVAQGFDAASLELRGDPIPLVDAPPAMDLDAEPIATASNDGRLVVLDNPPPDTRLAWLDRRGALQGTLSLPPGPWGVAVLSPDDRYAIVANGNDLWRIDLARSIPLRLTSGDGYHVEPVWSPDGSQIAYTGGGSGHQEIYVIDSDGSGEPRLVPTTENLFKFVSDWTRDGMVLTDLASGRVRDLLLVPYPKEGALTPLVRSPHSEGFGKVSPDGRWMAYVSNEAGNPGDLYLQAFPRPGRRTRVSTGGAEAFWWMPGSDELCYRAASPPDTVMMSVELTRRGAEMEVGEPRVLFRFPPEADGSAFTHDGQRVLVTLSSGGAGNRRARLILNWAATLGN